MLKLQKVLNKRATLLRVNWSQIKRCQLLQAVPVCIGHSHRPRIYNSSWFSVSHSNVITSTRCRFVSISSQLWNPTMFYKRKLLRRFPPFTNHVKATKQKRMLQKEFRYKSTCELTVSSRDIPSSSDVLPMTRIDLIVKKLLGEIAVKCVAGGVGIQ